MMSVGPLLARWCRWMFPSVGLALAAGILACADKMVDPAPAGYDGGGPEFLQVSLRPDGDTVAVHDSLQLTASLPWTPTLTIQSLLWASSDTSVATVSGTGMVYARKPGGTGVRVIVHTTQGRGGMTIAVVHVR